MFLRSDSYGSRFGILSFVVVLVLVLGASPASAQTKPPVAPAVTVDPTQPNLFYGAVPPNGLNGPVIVFVHGLGGSYTDWLDQQKNDMYDFAYQNGFRTVFLSMNLDNSPGNANIQTNAAMLQVMFPKILAHYNVTQLYFVCHSKGGLDLQDAIANPQWIGIAKAVFTMGTPNQGAALADWLFSPAGQAIGQLLGLLNPGEQSLEISNVQQLRTQWDPIFATAKIPFYTIAGNTFACPGGQTCLPGITGPILQSITGGAPPAGNAPPNDGLVTIPETSLPTTYAMAMGVVNVQHFAERLGDNTFPYIYARIMTLENQQPGFAKVATGGFGDQHNTCGLCNGLREIFTWGQAARLPALPPPPPWLRPGRPYIRLPSATVRRISTTCHCRPKFGGILLQPVSGPGFSNLPTLCRLPTTKAT